MAKSKEMKIKGVQTGRLKLPEVVKYWNDPSESNYNAMVTEIIRKHCVLWWTVQGVQERARELLGRDLTQKELDSYSDYFDSALGEDTPRVADILEEMGLYQPEAALV